MHARIDALAHDGWLRMIKASQFSDIVMPPTTGRFDSHDFSHASSSPPSKGRASAADDRFYRRSASSPFLGCH
jgi:hypothetical protein